jgi:uncharacterized protein (TIGR02996 family)
MLQHVAFLSAIDDAPREAVHRLAYADWLDEQRERLGDLLRVQGEILRPGQSAAALEVLTRRELNLTRHTRPGKRLLKRLRPWPEAAAALERHVLTPLSPDPDAFVCPACQGTKHWRLDLRNPIVWHWVLNPGLAVNELILGQRLPAVTYICRGCGPGMGGQFARCPGCRRFLCSTGPPFDRPLGNWFGYDCPHCGTSIPLIYNAVTAAVVVAGRLLTGYGWLWGKKKPPG